MKNKVSVVIGALIILGFGGLIVVLLGRTDAETEEWSRLVYLLGAIEAMAFVAAGFFFGTEVNRKRAQNAEASAVGAQEDAKDARKDAGEAEKRAAEAETKGRSLSAAIRAKVTSQSEKQALQEGRGEGGQVAAVSELTELRALADTLFP